jgi:TolB-like protein/tetratricopeptide (TPR) repeat protein
VTVADLLGEDAIETSKGRESAGNVVLGVLPIRCAPTKELDQFLAAGLCDDLVARLAKLRSVLVIGPESTRPLVEAGRTVTSIGEELNAKAVLTGSLRQLSPDRLHLNLHLIEVATNVTIWSEVFDLPFADLGSVQTDVAGSVAQGLQLRLFPGEAGILSARSTDVVKAYEFYLRGVGLVSTNQQRDVAVGLGMFSKAIELDDNFAEAHAFRGYALWRQYFSGWDADVATLHRALESIDRALSLDPACAAARLARIRVYWDLGKHEPALAEGLIVVRQQPASLDAILALARAYNNAGMAELAIPLTLRVLTSDPSNPAAKKLLIWNYLMTRDFSRSAARGDSYLEANPEDANTAWAVAMAHLQLREFDTTIRIVNRGLEADRFDFTLWLLLGYSHRQKGDEQAARKAWAKGAELVASRLGTTSMNHRVSAWLANLQAGSGAESDALATVRTVSGAAPENSYLQYRIAHAYAELGRPLEAIDALTAAIRNGFLSVQLLRTEEMCALGHLATDSRYETTLKNLYERLGKLRRKYPLPVSVR